MIDHPSHVTRFSDSSRYDEVCVLCGATDAHGDRRLESPCPTGRNLKQSHRVEVDRDSRSQIRCCLCQETSPDMLASAECPIGEKPTYTATDADVQRQIEHTDGRDAPEWLDQVAYEITPPDTFAADLAAFIRNYDAVTETDKALRGEFLPMADEAVNWKLGALPPVPAPSIFYADMSIFGVSDPVQAESRMRRPDRKVSETFTIQVDVISEDGKTPQHGLKLPDADFIPLYRSEKDA